ncbi:MAG TPA: class I SAM-dependent methyltransferase, partial [Pirellulales bacterium]|nr:class I SAM-dependent methyltransferase [Pirellulales bacterium]
MRDIARSTYYLVRGGGEGHILRKKEYHRRRALSERAVLAEAQRDPTLFRRNVCPACGSAANSADGFSNPIGFSFRFCPSDGTLFMDPVPTESTLKRLYNDASYSFLWTSRKSLDSVQVKPEGQIEFDQIYRNFQFPSDRRPTLLDVGCATGGLLLTAKSHFDVEGVELSEELAQIARKQGFAVTTGTLADVPGEGRFDVITMLQLIEHIVDPTPLVQEVRRLLRSGGILYLNTPNIDSASFKLFRERHMHVSSFGHVSLYTRASLDCLARRCGFQVVAHEYSGGMDISLHDLFTY